LQKKIAPWKVGVAFVAVAIVSFILFKLLDNAFRKNAHHIIHDDLERIRYTLQLRTDCRNTMRSLTHYTPDLNIEPARTIGKYCSTDPNVFIPEGMLHLRRQDFQRGVANFYWPARYNGLGATWKMKVGCFIENGDLKNPKARRCLTVHAAVLNFDNSFRRDPLTDEELAWRPLFNPPLCCVDPIEPPPPPKPAKKSPIKSKEKKPRGKKGV